MTSVTHLPFAEPDDDFGHCDCHICAFARLTAYEKARRALLALLLMPWLPLVELRATKVSPHLRPWTYVEFPDDVVLQDGDSLTFTCTLAVS
jgi:hypothetical protein